MKIRYMGTAAAEGIPAVFCQCNLCRYARQYGGKDKRTRSQSLVNDDLLIDFPPDSYMHYQLYNFDLPQIENLLVTHNHTDHFYATDLEMRCEPLAHPEPKVMHVYSNSTVRDMFYARMPKKYNVTNKYDFCVIEPYKTYQVGNYKVTPMLAQHDKTQQCVFYGIAEGNKKLLYAHDSGYFPDPTWEYLESDSACYNLISLDGNAMCRSDGKNHMGLPDAIKVKKRLLEIGAANEKTIFVMNHFSHNGGLTHAQLQEAASDYGFLISYDGLELEF